jgi:hypothetical protein
MKQIEEMLKANFRVNRQEPQGDYTVRPEFFVHGGFMRRVPSDWQFPRCAIILAYEHWHCPDEMKKVLALKHLKKYDVSFIKRGSHFLF